MVSKRFLLVKREITLLSFSKTDKTYVVFDKTCPKHTAVWGRVAIFVFWFGVCSFRVALLKRGQHFKPAKGLHQWSP